MLIDALQGSQTVIIVTHLIYRQNCDQIFRLEDGNLVKSGTPAKILRKSNNHSNRT